MQSEFLLITLFTNTDRPICKKDEKEEANMKTKLAFVSALMFLALMSVLQSAKAATIPSAALDRDSYFAGETGYISVSLQ
jgi:hypothetical protein